MLFPIRVDVRESRRLRAALFFVHAMAVAAILVTGLSGWFQGVLLAGVAASAFVQWRRHRRDGCLILERNGSAAWQPASVAVAVPLQALDGIILTRWLIVLRCLPADGARSWSMVLAHDSAEISALRRLRVWLGWVRSEKTLREASGASSGIDP